MTNEEFLVITPPEFVKIPGADELIYLWGEDNVVGVIARQEWGVLDGLIESAGLLPEGMTVSGGKFFREGADLHLWAVYSPLT